MVPRDGLLEVGLTHTLGGNLSPPFSPINIWTRGAAGPQVWMDVHYPDVEAFARIPATAGETYQAGVVSYEIPGVTFQLRVVLGHHSARRESAEAM